jgi:hypothetical protein
VSRRNIFYTSATPPGIKREWYVCMYVCDKDSKRKNLKRTQHTNQYNRLNFRKSNIIQIRHALNNISWPTLLSSSDVNVNIDIFYDKFNKILSEHTPIMSRNSDNYPVWLNTAVKKCLSEKKKYHKLYKKFQNPRDYDVFSMLRARCKRLICECYKNYVASVENELNNNIKCFWSFVNSKRSIKNNLPQSMKYNGSVASDTRGMCELFSRYFGSVFEENSNIVYTPENPQLISSHSLSTVYVSEKDILNKIKRLDINKSTSPDKIPPLIIKQCAKELTQLLHIIFNQSLSTGVFPDIWKTAHIIPIFKTGEKTCCENYRPISILSCLAKLLESVVYDIIYSHVQPLLSPCQHGFTKNKSTISNLLEYKNYLCSAFAKHVQTDSIYTDFSKAFDKVNHALLCRKLQMVGLHGSLLRWVESYLSRRSQLVALKAELSSPVYVTSGVPQGSHLGPLFFIIFINDLIDQLHCPCLLYADDLKVFSTIERLKNSEVLQRDLDTISQWCVSNRMFLNVEKCFVVTFTRKVNKLNFQYTINGQALKRHDQAKDLGITFDSKLYFKMHYNSIHAKASQLLGFVLRVTKDFKNINSVIYLFNCLVRSNLEYGSIIWSPFYEVHSKRIESVQSKFVRCLSHRWGLYRKLTSYSERLTYFNMRTLETRRQLSDLMCLFKIVNYYIDSPSLISLINFNTYHKTRNPRLFSLQVFRNNTSFFNPLIRMCRLYNELSLIYKDLDMFNSTLNSFRFKVHSVVGKM